MNLDAWITGNYGEDNQKTETVCCDRCGALMRKPIRTGYVYYDYCEDCVREMEEETEEETEDDND